MQYKRGRRETAFFFAGYVRKRTVGVDQWGYNCTDNLQLNLHGDEHE